MPTRWGKSSAAGTLSFTASKENEAARPGGYEGKNNRPHGREVIKVAMVKMDVVGKFWTRQSEMLADLEGMGYEVIEADGESVVVIDTNDENEAERVFHICTAGSTMWIADVE